MVMSIIEAGDCVEQSAERGLAVMVITSGRRATSKLALAVCLIDPMVNPHSYVPVRNMQRS